MIVDTVDNIANSIHFYEEIHKGFEELIKNSISSGH